MSETVSAVPAPEPALAAAVPRRRNTLGLVALIVAIIAFFTPLIVLIIGIVIVVTNPLPGVDSGWNYIQVAVYFFFGAGIAAIPGVIAIALGIGSLFVKNAGHVTGIIAIVIGAIMALASIPLLPLGLVMFTG